MALAESSGEAVASPAIRVEVVCSPGPRQVELKALTLPAGSTVRQAVEASGLVARAGVPSTGHVGIWGRVTTWSHVLRDQDRIELYRPLKADPKESRRLRYKKQRPTKTRGR
ncbi:RnfH family protein [Aquabacterium sp.]|uniref:RnfH family protein n=1 Tax=Aquabacterium sp. TaxID=1872578 RepID=UPI0035B2B3E8